MKDNLFLLVTLLELAEILLCLTEVPEWLAGRNAHIIKNTVR